MSRLIYLLAFSFILCSLISLTLGNVFTFLTQSVNLEEVTDKNNFFNEKDIDDDNVNLENDDANDDDDDVFIDLGKYSKTKNIIRKARFNPDIDDNVITSYNPDKDDGLANEKFNKRSNNEDFQAKVIGNEETESLNENISPFMTDITKSNINSIISNFNVSNNSNAIKIDKVNNTNSGTNVIDNNVIGMSYKNVLPNNNIPKLENNLKNHAEMNNRNYIPIIDQSLPTNINSGLIISNPPFVKVTISPFLNLSNLLNTTINFALPSLLNSSTRHDVMFSDIMQLPVTKSGTDQWPSDDSQQTTVSSFHDTCIAGNVKASSAKDSSDEVKIARNIKEFVKGVIARSGNMRKELGLCKTYDQEYVPIKGNGMDEDAMKNVMSCINRLTDSKQSCGELQPDLVQFLDWLLLSGISARDEYKHFCAGNSQPQSRHFLFLKEESGNEKNNTDLSIYAAESKLDMTNKFKTNYKNKTSLLKQFKGALMDGLSPYIRYRKNDKRNTNKQYINNNDNLYFSSTLT